MKKGFILAPLILLVALSIPATAHSEKDNDGDHDGVKAAKLAPEGVKIKGDEFKIQGQITAISGNTFVVAGQTIVIDPSKVSKFREKGILTVGNTVKVEGVIVSGTKFAQDLNMIGTGQGRFQFTVKTQPSVSIGTTAPVTQGNVQVKAVGPASQVTTFLTQVIAFLKGLL